MNLEALFRIVRSKMGPTRKIRLKAAAERSRLFNERCEQEARQQISRERCMHLVWLPETKQNGWRETCRDCGLQAAGSCQ